jgi:hypothetical protein
VVVDEVGAGLEEAPHDVLRACAGHRRLADDADADVVAIDLEVAAGSYRPAGGQGAAAGEQHGDERTGHGGETAAVSHRRPGR